MEWGPYYVWDSMGDAGYYCFSSFCLEELVGNLIFKGLEYGTNMSYVVNMEGTQCPNFWGHWETYRYVEELAC